MTQYLFLLFFGLFYFEIEHQGPDDVLAVLAVLVLGRRGKISKMMMLEIEMENGKEKCTMIKIMTGPPY